MMAAVAHIVSTQQLKRFIDTPELDTPASTLRAALDAVFALNPRLRGYVLDDQGHLRANVVAFIAGRRCHERVCLDDALRPDSRVHVMGSTTGNLWASDDGGDRWVMVPVNLPPIHAVRFD